MRDRIISVLSFAFGLTVFIMANAFARSGEGIIGNPAMYPRILAVAMMVLSVVLFIRSFFTKDEDTHQSFTFTVEGMLNVAIGVSILLAYVYILVPVGFILSTAAFVLISLLFFKASIKQSLILFVPITLSVYFVFATLLNVPLPSGIFF